MQNLYVGVDGGATKVTVRVEDEAGNLFGQATGGPANIRLSVTESWAAIHATLQRIIALPAFSNYSLHAGMGLAGTEIASAYQAFLQQAHPFKTLMVTSDAHTACLGAHGGQDGRIIVIGTGVIGYQIVNESTQRVSGWGFPHDDRGGGAWLGLEAVNMTLQWLDKRRKNSGLAQAVFNYFHQDQARLVAWANQANSTAYAELAPLVIQQSQQGDALARDILQQAAHAIEQVYAALLAHQDQVLPCTLTGGIAAFIQPLLAKHMQAQLSPCLGTPEWGGILLIKKHLAQEFPLKNARTP